MLLAGLAGVHANVDQARRKAGAGAIHDLGANRRECGPWQVDPDVVLREVDINALGPMLITRTVLPLLEAGENPVVLNTSSQLGSMVIGAA